MEQWIAIGLTALAWLVAIAVMWGKFSNRMDHIEAEQTKQNKYHAEHFERIGKTETLTAESGQKLHDHEKSDDDRFQRIDERCGRIEDMCKETRTDVKDILKSVKGSK